MKQKFLLLIILVAMLFSACNTNNKETNNENTTKTYNSGEVNNSKDTKSQVESKPKPLNLTGNWESEHNNGSWMGGYIEKGVIEIYWISDNGDTKSLYWSGSYKAPTKETEADTYKWSSKNNTKKTESALLASNDKTKKFTYSDNEITFSASALGTTKKMHFKRTKTNYK